MYRRYIIGFFIYLSSQIYAVSDSHIKVKGEIFYKKSGLLHPMIVSLALPPMGQGDVFLKLQSHPDWIKANSFFYESKSQRKIFYMIFPHYEDHKVLVFKGTYARGDNLVLYYGDMFEMGIIDPVKVVRTALENAASASTMMLTVGCAMVEESLDAKFEK